MLIKKIIGCVTISVTVFLVLSMNYYISTEAKTSNDYLEGVETPELPKKTDVKGLAEKQVEKALKGEDVPHIEGELFIGFEEDLSTLTRESILKKAKLETLPRKEVTKDSVLITGIEGNKQRQDKLSKKLDSLVRDLSQIQGVAWVEPNYLSEIKPASLPNDTSFSNQWNLHGTGQIVNNITTLNDGDIDAPEAWNISKGDDIVIAVLDDGIGFNHPDLAGQIAINYDDNTIDGVDDDSNGYIDDWRGWDFIQNDNNPDVSNLMNDGSSGGYEYVHGLSMSGIIGAKQNNNYGISGVCPNCKILPIRMLSPTTLESTATVINYLDYAKGEGVNVINMSFYDQAVSQTIQSKINELFNNNVLIVACAGNDNTQLPTFPANYNNVLAVGALNQDNTKASYSNFNAQIGVSVPVAGKTNNSNFSELLTPTTRWSNVPNQPWTISYSGGTSAAAAITSGVAGLVLGLDNLFTSHQVYNILTSSGDNLDAANPSHAGMLGKRLNAEKAVKAARLKILNYRDINRDGRDDIITRQKTPTSKVEYWMMDNQNRLALIPASFTIDAAEHLAASGDFNADKKIDLVWHNPVTGTTQIWISPNPPVTLASNVFDWIPVAAGDFNGDRKADLVWRNVSQSKTAIWMMNGATQQSSVVLSPSVGSAWEVRGVGDFNGDGKSDLVWREAYDSNNPNAIKSTGVWYMNGTTVLSTPILNSTVTYAWDIAGTGDPNQDGQSDLIWRDFNSNNNPGQIGYWYLNGLIATSQILIPYTTASATYVFVHSA